MFTTELCPFDKTTFRIRYFYGEPGHNYRTSEVWRWHSPESLKLRMWIIARIAKITTAEPDSHMRIEDLLGPRLSRALVKQLKFSHGTWSYNIYSYRILSSQVPPYAFRERDEIRSLGLYLRYTSSYHLQIFNYNVYSPSDFTRFLISFLQ